MRRFTLETELWLPFSQEDVFAFFADHSNLETITPPWLRFEVLTPGPIEMRRGALIDYRLRWHGIPIKWRSEITAWEPPVRFVDEQLSGPYRFWLHEHTFIKDKGGTIVRDRVEYSVYGGFLVDRLFVAGDLKGIFSYRHGRIRAIFSRGAQELSK